MTITNRRRRRGQGHRRKAGQPGHPLRAGSDRNEKIGFKIREAQLDKIPYMLVLGDKEAENGTVAVRGRKGDLGTMGVDEIIAKLMEEIRTKAIN